jgi:hypothetical protein
VLVSEMLSEIRDHGFDDLTDTRILGFLNDTYEDVCSREPWPFLEATASVTVNASGRVTDPTDVGKVLAMSHTTSGMPNIHPIRLEQITQQAGDRLTETGDSVAYYFIGNELYLWPIPSSPSIVLRYLRTPAALTVTPDSSPILPRHQRVLVLGALVKCYALEDDPENAASFQQQFENRLLQMRTDLWTRQFDETEVMLDVEDDDWLRAI